MRVPLILEVQMVMLSLTYTPWHSRTDNNLKIFIEELSDFNSKLSSMDKIYLLQDFSSRT